MVREKLVGGMIDYFHSEQWNQFMSDMLLRKDGCEVYHAHIYTDTCIHPDSVSEIVNRYFDAVNRPLTRQTDPQANRPGVASIHGIAPIDCMHFEIVFRFNKDAVMEAMPKSAPEAEHGENLLCWDKDYIDAALTKVPFRSVGPQEDRIIQEYFHSRFWKMALDGILDERYTHFHLNFELNFHPKILELYMRQEFAKIGWTLDRVVPAVFDMGGLIRARGIHLAEDDPRNAYINKLNFNLAHPQKMFDVAWMFNPDVTLRPAQQGWIFGTRYFDGWPAKNYAEFIAQSDYIHLTEEEICEIEKSFYIDNPYVRKI